MKIFFGMENVGRLISGGKARIGFFIDDSFEHIPLAIRRV
jgi:hypothetical protein